LVIDHYKSLYGNSKDYTTQLRALEKSLKKKPADPALWFLTGFHYAYLGFTQQAIDQLDRVVELAPHDDLARQLREDLRGKLATPAVPSV
jgi:regulator of sirC expression with transglutaminase-like and TPR domain